MLAEIRDLRAHATISRMHQQEERDRLADKVTSTEDLAVKKERQLKREGNYKITIILLIKQRQGLRKSSDIENVSQN